MRCAAPDVVGGRGQRLVELHAPGPRPSAHRAQPRRVQQFLSQLLQPRAGMLPLGEVAYEAGEQAPAPEITSPTANSIGNVLPFCAAADHDAADADDPPLARSPVAVADSRQGCSR